MAKSEYFQIKKMHIAFLVAVILLLAASFYLPKIFSKININLNTKPVSEETENICKKFCFLANTEYAFTKDESCYCNQRQLIYNKDRNETIIIIQTTNAGMIKNITIEKGLTQEALRLLEMQQVQQIGALR